MKKVFLVLISFALIAVGGCRKKNDDRPVSVSPVTEQEVLTDFADVLVNPNYRDIEAKANLLNASVQALNTLTTDANLINAQNAWRAVRMPWEQAEAYLFGPVDYDSYDPMTDTWPVTTAELDSLLASSNPLTLADVEALPNSFKGYHAIEYLLFGVGGSKKAIDFDARQHEYLVSLTQSLHIVTGNLRKSWDVNDGNFTAKFVNAGNGSTFFATRKDAFLAIVDAMSVICNEVAVTKMEPPLSSHDSTIVESQYAHNATTDFKNNIIGIQNVYMCTYGSSGRSLHHLVAAKDAELDKLIQSQIAAAISSFDDIDANYGEAIFSQQGQILASISMINSLGNTLNLLENFIHTNIKD